MELTGIFKKRGKGSFGMRKEDKEGWRPRDRQKNGWMDFSNQMPSMGVAPESTGRSGDLYICSDKCAG